MKEENLKPINIQNNEQLKQIQPSSNNNKQTLDKNNKYKTIKNLPTWSIEPPLEIKRGN